MFQARPASTALPASGMPWSRMDLLLARWRRFMMIGAAVAMAMVPEYPLGATPPQDNPPVVINDEEMLKKMEVAMLAMHREKKGADAATLRSQMNRTTCELALPPAKPFDKDGNIYDQLHDSVVVVGCLEDCGEKSCKEPHLNTASGFIIREDGIIVTNHHVVDGNLKYDYPMAVMTPDGKIFPVAEVLASNKNSDIAILRIQGAAGLDALPLKPRDAPVGTRIMVISHPEGVLYYMTEGIVSRYCVEPESGGKMMNVTAPFAGGSSGAPVINGQGEVVGMVASSLSLSYDEIPVVVGNKNTIKVTEDIDNKDTKVIGLDHEMTINYCVPVSAIRAILKDPPAN